MIHTASPPVFQSIQYLRAFAALCVVWFHFAVPGATFGAFGVDIFFIISGFLMTHICAHDPTRFFMRRLIRILPMYWLCTLGIFMIALVAPTLLNSTTANVENLLKSLFFIPYIKENGALQPMLLVGWTLNYEMFFYALVALSLYVVPARYATLLCSAALGLLVMIIGKSGCTTLFCQFYGNAIMLEFAFGVLLYWSLPLLRGIVRGAYTLPARMNAIITPVGDASYVIYLIHFYVIQVFNLIVAPRAPMLSLHQPLGMLLCMASVIGVSIVLHRHVELPMIRALKRALLRP